MKNEKKTLIRLPNGNLIDLSDLKEELFDIEDIAHSLSMQCRFNGNISEFYSVAEHCCLMALNMDKQYSIYGLLHDAHETFIGDIITPFTHVLGIRQKLEVMKTNYDDIILSKFGLVSTAHPMYKKHIKPEIEKLDNLLFLRESNELFKSHPYQEMKPTFSELAVPWPMGLSPLEAEELFLKMFNQLTQI